MTEPKIPSDFRASQRLQPRAQPAQPIVMSATITYGDGVYQLAESFIDDAKIIDRNMRLQETHELAMEIQRAIDDWFFTREH